MVQGQKGVVEVQRGNLVGHLGVVGAAWVAVAQDDVVQPVWDDALRVHQVSDGFQHGLKHRAQSCETDAEPKDFEAKQQFDREQSNSTRHIRQTVPQVGSLAG